MTRHGRDMCTQGLAWSAPSWHFSLPRFLGRVHTATEKGRKQVFARPGAQQPGSAAPPRRGGRQDVQALAQPAGKDLLAPSSVPIQVTSLNAPPLGNHFIIGALHMQAADTHTRTHRHTTKITELPAHRFQSRRRGSCCLVFGRVSSTFGTDFPCTVPLTVTRSHHKRCRNPNRVSPKGEPVEEGRHVTF